MEPNPPRLTDARDRFARTGLRLAHKRRLEHTNQTIEWRRDDRWAALRLIARRAERIEWSSTLLQFLLEELWADEEFKHLVDRVHRLRPAHYPQAIAVAIALRHSWRRDDLRRTARRLGISTRRL